MSRRSLLGLGIVSACGGSIHAPTHAPAAADRISAIRIEGNRAIATAALEPALALHEAAQGGAAIDPYLVTVDAERIRAAYLKRGFFDAQVTTRVDRDARSQVVVFMVAEGRRAVTRVEIAGLPPELPRQQARALVALGDGAPFDYVAYEAAKQPLTALVQNAGYAHAAVYSAVVADRAAATATARYEIAPGVRCTFGAIRVRGEVRESLVAAVRARLRFATGDRFSQVALDQSQAEIYEIGRFSTVQVVPAPPADPRAGAASDAAVVDVAIELVEASRHELHVGGGVGYDPATYEARGRVGGSFVPLPVPLLTLGADLTAAITIPHNLDREQLLPKLRGLVSLQYLDLLWPRLRGEAEVGADYQTVEAYTWTGEHVRLGLGTPLGPRWLQLRVGWVLEELQFTGVDGAIDEATRQRLRLDRPQRRGAYQASLVADLRDNPIEPRRGVYVDLRATRGTALAGGDLTYLQLTPEVRGYVSLGALVVAARVRVGAIYGDVPVTERYYSGGTIGQRGFPDRRLSPLATSEDGSRKVVIGGAGLIETGLELRRRLGTLWSLPVGANVFLDGGDVTETPEQLDPSNLYWAIGAGGWSKLVGDLKLRVDLGYRLNERGPEDPLRTTSWLDNVAFHLGLGEAY